MSALKPLFYEEDADSEIYSEALERLDSRVRHQDLAARHYMPNPITMPHLKDLKNRDNKLAQQMRYVSSHL